jgi:hypothetical protein
MPLCTAHASRTSSNAVAALQASVRHANIERPVDLANAALKQDFSRTFRKAL